MPWSNISQSYWNFPDYYKEPWLLLPSKEDFSFTMLVALFLTLARVYVQSATMKLAKHLEVKENVKFSESCWKSLYYVSSTTVGLTFVFTSDWFPNTANCWRNYPDGMPISTPLRIFTLYQLGFYWHSLYAHFVYEVKRSDYWPLLLHHIATIVLINCSYQMNFHRIGLLIVVAHDVNDVFFEIGKLFVYMQKERVTNVLFVFLLISWVTTRLGIFPFMLIYSALFESQNIIPYDISPFWLIFNSMLLFLLTLHIYWFGLMLRMAVRVVRGKEKKIVDSREENGKKKLSKSETEGDSSPVIESAGDIQQQRQAKKNKKQN